MSINHYHKAVFLKSAAKLSHLPADTGYEVAFAGRSNAGKSSALNALANIKRLARTSKTPGRTQLINLFAMDDERRLVDLPGYGFAKVNQSIKAEWQHTLQRYLENRECLKGLVVLADIRHPLKDLDKAMISWALHSNLPVHLLLNKADKLSAGARHQALVAAHKFSDNPLLSVQIFSALNKIGLEELIIRLDEWFELTPVTE